MDPVVSEKPIFLSNAAGSNLLLAQYPTKKPNTETKTRKLQLKPESNVVGTTLSTPVNSTYIDSTKTNNSNALTQEFAGNIQPTNSRLVLAQNYDDKLVLHIVPQSAQLRPQFKVKQPEQQPIIDQKDQQLRSVQMSVKSTTQEQPKHSGVLEFYRQVDKEKWQDMQISEANVDAKQLLSTYSSQTIF